MLLRLKEKELSRMFILNCIYLSLCSFILSDTFSFISYFKIVFFYFFVYLLLLYLFESRKMISFTFYMIKLNKV